MINGRERERQLPNIEILRQRAVNVLDGNTVRASVNGGQLIEATFPSKGFYEGIWGWDPDFVAMGLIHIPGPGRQQRAFRELEASLHGQWQNGMIPQITFLPHESGIYYPGSQEWRTDAFRNGEIRTSGISQPPTKAIATKYVYEHAPDKDAAIASVEGLLPALERSHRYFKTFRDPEDIGLLTVIHPWESGTDNSPRWDSVYAQHINLAAIPNEFKQRIIASRTDNRVADASHRPTDTDYIHYMYLVKMYADMGWDPAEIVKNSPFAVKDILFNSIWAKANESLAELLRKVGRPEDAVQYDQWAEQTRDALDKTWSPDHGQYCDIDVRGNRFIVEPTIAMFMPFLAGAVTPDKWPVLAERLTDVNEFWTPNPLPSLSISSPKFDPRKYWRGSVWKNKTKFVSGGTKRYATQYDNPLASAINQELDQRSLNNMIVFGLWEYSDPHSGVARPGREETTALGHGDFSWTAANALRLIDEVQHPERHVLTFL